MLKLAFVLLLLMDISHTNKQQKIEELTNILLSLGFPPFYNRYSKSCCKLYPRGCYLMLDSNGYMCDFLKGRVTKTEGDGWIQFKISNVQFNDQGFYRCTVMGTSIYTDYYVELADASRPYTQPLLKTTMKAPSSSTTLLEPTAPGVGQDYSDPPRDPWSLPLPAIVSIAAVICISSVAGLVFCCVRAKQKQSNTKQTESLQTEASETSAIVYTTVDFKAHHKPTVLYENLRVNKTQEDQQAPEHAGNVEYSTLAVHQYS